MANNPETTTGGKKPRKPYKKREPKPKDTGLKNIRLSNQQRGLLIDVLKIVGTVDKHEHLLQVVPCVLEIAGTIGYPVTLDGDNDGQRAHKNLISIIWKKMVRLYTPKPKFTPYIDKSKLQKVDIKAETPEEKQARNSELMKLLEDY